MAKVRTLTFRLLLALLAVVTAVAASAEELVRHGRLDHGPLSEVSGIVASGYDGHFWVHNDSGDEARLFAITSTGELVIPPYLARRYEDQPWPGLTVLNAFNVDWEDLARGSDGTLYIPDLGNNGNARRDLGVYVVPEPNPEAVGSTRALTFLPVRYPDQQSYPAERWHFDCEAVFESDGRLYFLTKHRKPGEIMGWEPGTKLYRLDTQHSNEVNVLTLVSSRADVVLATGADLSPDREHLAVLSYLGVWLFARPETGDDWLAGSARFVELPRETLRTSEAITWLDADTLLIANEERDLLTLDLAALP